MKKENLRKGKIYLKKRNDVGVLRSYFACIAEHRRGPCHCNVMAFTPHLSSSGASVLCFVDFSTSFICQRQTGCSLVTTKLRDGFQLVSESSKCADRDFLGQMEPERWSGVVGAELYVTRKL